jgi:hypothetical protein
MTSAAKITARTIAKSSMKVAFNIILIAMASIVCLIGLEVFTRTVIDTGTVYELEMWKYAREVKMRDSQPDLGHRHQANAHAALMNVDVRTESHGLRGPEIANQAAPGIARIAFVGDSITMGWGVEEKETFAHQVIEGLTRASHKVDGFNLGVGNYNTLQELALFRQVGVPLKPDIVVLAYFINDAEPIPTYSDDDWLTEHSAAWVVLKYRLNGLLRQSGEAPDWRKYYRDLYKPDAPGWIQAQKALRGFAETARQLGVELLVFNMPELHELKPYPFEDVTAKVRAVVEKDGLPFFDLLPTVQNLNPASLWVTVPDPHPNGVANTAFTKGMIEKLTPVLEHLCRAKGKGCGE